MDGAIKIKQHKKFPSMFCLLGLRKYHCPVLSSVHLFCLHLSFNLSQSIFNNFFSFTHAPVPPLLICIGCHFPADTQLWRPEVSHLWVDSAVVSVRFSTSYVCTAILQKQAWLCVLVLRNDISNFFFFQARTDLPPNTPTNLVLQLYSLGTGPNTSWRQRVRVTYNLMKLY